MAAFLGRQHRTATLPPGRAVAVFRVHGRRRGGNAPSARINLTPSLDPPPCDEAPGEAEDVRDPEGRARRWGAPMPGCGGSPGGDQEDEDGEEDDAAGRDVAHDGSLESAPAGPP